MTQKNQNKTKKQKKPTLFEKIPHSMRRTTGVNIGLFVFILLHFYHANSKYGHEIKKYDFFLNMEKTDTDGILKLRIEGKVFM